MTHGRTYNCVSRWIFLCACAWFGCLSALGAAIQVRFKNNGTVPVYPVFYYKQPSDSQFWGSNGGTIYPDGEQLINWDRTLPCEVKVYWGLSSSTRHDNEAYHEDGAIVYTFTSAGSSPWFVVNYTPPAPEYRFDAYLVNQTHSGQYYWVGKLSDGSLIWEGFLMPGGQTYISLTDQPATFDIHFRNDGNDFPPLAVTVQDNDDFFWRPMDTGIFTPEAITHNYMAPGSTNQFAINWDEQPDQESTNNQGTLTEGTYKTGIEALYGQNRDIGNNLLVTLRDMRDQLGGDKMAKAATNISESAVKLSQSASNLAQAANNLTNQTGVIDAINRLNSSNQSGFLGMLSKLDLLTSNHLAFLEQVKTNNAGDSYSTNELQSSLAHFQSVANQSMAGASNQFGAIKDKIEGMTNGVGGYSANTNFWRLSFPVGAKTYSINLNPMNNSMIQKLATWIKYAISWLSAAALLYFIVEECQKAVWHQGAYAQIFAPDLKKQSWIVSIVSKIPGVGGIAGLIAAAGPHMVVFVVIAGLLSAIAIVATTYVLTFGLETPGVSPFSPSTAGGDTFLLQGMWLVDQFIDVPLLVLHWVYAGAFRVVLIVNALAVQAGIKAIPANMSAWLILGLTVASANAFDVRFHNGTSEPLVIGSGGLSPEIHVPSGLGVAVPDFVGPELFIWLASDQVSPIEVIDLTALGAITDEDRITLIRGIVDCRIKVEPAVMWAFELGAQVGVAGVTVMALVYLGRLLRPSSPGAVE